MPGACAKHIEQLRAMSRAFAEACVKRSKNSRFWGLRLSAIGAFYQSRSPDRLRNRAGAQATK